MNGTLKRLPRLTSSQKDQIVRMFDVDKLSMREIGAVFGRSAASIQHVLRERGVETSKAVACHVEVTCHWCEAAFSKTRSQARINKKHHFCSHDCYLDWLHELGKDYLPDRNGQRTARRIVSGIIGEFAPEWIVHHIDGSALNNNPHNLMVFASQRDHIRFHRGMDHVAPLWDGRDVYRTGNGVG